MVADHSVIPDPEDLTAEEWRAKCEYYLNKELVKQAAECAQNAVARDEKDHLNWYWLARANTVDLGSRYDGEEEQKALLDKGIELYEKSLALKSDYAPAWIGLSKIYETGHAGRPRYDEEKVVECLCKALEADSKCEEAYSELVGRYNISAESSLGLARKWTENLPENPRAWYEYAKYLDGDENRAERIAAYETILALQRVPLALYQLGREYRSIDLEKSAFYFSQLTIEDKARMYDYMWADMLEAIKELTRKLTPIVKEELVDVRSEEPVFLTIETNGSSLTTTTGILGTAGESETTAFDSEAECQKAAHALYESKLGQYYPVAELRLRLDLEYEQSPEARALEAFYAEQLRKIRSQPGEDLAKLPKAIADPLAVIGALDDEKIVADFKRSILSSVLEFKLKNTTGYTPQAMHFRWYYGGDSKENEAYGSFYEKFDRDGRPLFSGKSDQYDGEMNVGSVMSPLYEVYDELRDNDSVLLPLLQRLFEAKVYLLAEFAYREAEKLMDLPNFLMRRYDNDSVFIAAPRGDAE
jgi:predicted DNA-binding WGR domain protein